MNQYKGPERRIRPSSDRRACSAAECFEHSGLVAQIENLKSDADGLKEKNYLTWTNYKWSFGIIVSIFILLFSISLNLSMTTNEALKEIEKKQIAIMGNIANLQFQIEQLKKDIKNP